MINACQSLQDFEKFLQNSHHRPVFLFKHSSACSTSARAWKHFAKFAEEQSGAEYWAVQVIPQRALSQEIARRARVTHESPQVLLFQHGQVVWHASHGRITATALQESMQSLQKESPGLKAG